MSSFFKNTDLDLQKAEKIVSETLNKCDDGELYLEDTKSESIVLDDNKIKSSNYTKDSGYGFRAINGDVVAYSHSNDISEKSLRNSSKNLKSTLKNSEGIYNSEIKKTNQKFYNDLDPVDEKNLSDKSKILNETRKIFSIEAGSDQSWSKYINNKGLSFSINDFGKSAPYKKIYDHFGLNVEKICKKIKLNIKKNAN